jgi:hypothetical protein
LASSPNCPWSAISPIPSLPRLLRKTLWPTSSPFPSKGRYGINRDSHTPPIRFKKIRQLVLSVRRIIPNLSRSDGFSTRQIH